MCLIAPKIELMLLTKMLVPPAVGAAMPISNMAGRRMVPKARPTNPPNSPTANETTVSTTAFQIRTSDPQPKVASIQFLRGRSRRLYRLVQ